MAMRAQHWGGILKTSIRSFPHTAPVPGKQEPAHELRPHGLPAGARSRPRRAPTHCALVLNCSSFESSKYLRISLARCRWYSIVTALLNSSQGCAVGCGHTRRRRRHAGPRFVCIKARQASVRRCSTTALRTRWHARRRTTYIIALSAKFVACAAHSPRRKGRCRCWGRGRSRRRWRGGGRCCRVVKQLLGLLGALQLRALEFVTRQRLHAHDPLLLASVQRPWIGWTRVRGEPGCAMSGPLGILRGPLTMCMPHIHTCGRNMATGTGQRPHAGGARQVQACQAALQ